VIVTPSTCYLKQLRPTLEIKTNSALRSFHGCAGPVSQFSSGNSVAMEFPVLSLLFPVPKNSEINEAFINTVFDTFEALKNPKFPVKFPVNGNSDRDGFGLDWQHDYSVLRVFTVASWPPNNPMFCGETAPSMLVREFSRPLCMRNMGKI